MDMSKLEGSVRELAACELKRANEFHGPHSSTHQAYGVLLEEVQESEKEKYKIDRKMRKIWNAVKQDEYERIEKLIDRIEEPMTKCIAEMTQALAMVYKFKDYIKEVNK